MAKEMEVIFIEDQKGQFKTGQRRKVKLGYARNYLLPKRYAVQVSQATDALLKSISQKATKRDEEHRKIAEEVHQKVDGHEIKQVQKTHDEGKLYGSVTPIDIAAAINEAFNTQLDKHDLSMAPQLKECGTYQAHLVIHKDFKTKITIEITSENEDLTEKEEPKAEEVAEVTEEKTEEKAEENAEEKTEEVASDVQEETVAEEPTQEEA